MLPNVLPRVHHKKLVFLCLSAVQHVVWILRSSSTTTSVPTLCFGCERTRNFQKNLLTQIFKVSHSSRNLNLCIMFEFFKSIVVQFRFQLFWKKQNKVLPNVYLKYMVSLYFNFNSTPSYIMMFEICGSIYYSAEVRIFKLNGVWTF